MNRKYRNIYFVLILFLLPVNVLAAFYQNDWNSVGDNSIIFDDSTSLEWLSLSQTVGETYSHVKNQLAIGGEYEGFRLATLNEVITLVTNAGSSWGTCFSCPVEIPLMESLINMIGSGYSYSTGVSTWGYVLSDENSSFFSGVLLSVDYSANKKSAMVSGGFKNSNPYPNLGGFLVRPVPIPGAILLFGSPLLCFAGFRVVRGLV